jgi:hypothetical protein
LLPPSASHALIGVFAHRCCAAEKTSGNTCCLIPPPCTPWVESLLAFASPPASHSQSRKGDSLNFRPSSDPSNTGRNAAPHRPTQPRNPTTLAPPVTANQKPQPTDSKPLTKPTTPKRYH